MTRLPVARSISSSPATLRNFCSMADLATSHATASHFAGMNGVTARPSSLHSWGADATAIRSYVARSPIALALQSMIAFSADVTETRCGTARRKKLGGATRDWDDKAKGLVHFVIGEVAFGARRIAVAVEFKRWERRRTQHGGRRGPVFVQSGRLHHAFGGRNGLHRRGECGFH